MSHFLSTRTWYWLPKYKILHFIKHQRCQRAQTPQKNRLGGSQLLKCELFFTESWFGILACNTIKLFNRVGSNYKQVKQLSSVTKFMFHTDLIIISWQLRWCIVATWNILVFSRSENCPSVSGVVLISGGRQFWPMTVPDPTRPKLLTQWPSFKHTTAPVFTVVMSRVSRSLLDEPAQH